MRTLLTRVVQPIILYLVYAAVVTLLVPDNFRNLQSALLLIGIVQLVTRWGLRTARWIYHTQQRDVSAYLLAHFVLSVRMFFFVALVGYGFLTDGSWIARMVMVLALSLSIIRFLSALQHLVRFGTLFQYSNYWWRPLWDQATLEANDRLRQEPHFADSTVTRGQSTRTSQTTLDPTSEQVALSMFRDLIVDGSSTMPAGAAPIPQQRRRRWLGRKEISGEGMGFLEQARLNADRTRSAAPFVPFLENWPTYADMTRPQQAWYFYWRTELRKGNNLPTSISYLLVHAYELINLIGVSSPQDAFDQLVRLWQSYRDEQPYLDDCLIDWCADLLIVHQLPMQALDWYAQLAPLDCLPKGNEDLLLEAWVHGGGDFDRLNMDFLYRICGYTPKRNKFYQNYHEEIDFEEAFRCSLSAIDDHLRENDGQGLLLMHNVGAPAWYRRDPFSEAIHEYHDHYDIPVAEVRQWTASELVQTLASIIRQAENILRKEASFRAQLRDVTVPQGWEEIIRAAVVVPPPERKVEIDLAHADLIRQESETIRQRLIVEEEVEGEEVVEEELVIGADEYRGDTERDLDQPDPHVERDSEATEVMAAVATELENGTSTPSLDAEWIEFAALLQAKHWRALLVISEAQDVTSNLDTLARSVHSTANQLIDQINEFGLETIGDTIIETSETIPSVIDEYTQPVQALTKWAVQQQKIEDAP